MAATAKPRTPRAPAKPRAKKAAVVLPENRTPSEVVAAEILTAYRDLAPSVNRIMEAEFGEPGRFHAITLFKNSLGADGDPNRNPAKAIEAGLLADFEPPAAAEAPADGADSPDADADSPEADAASPDAEPAA